MTTTSMDESSDYRGHTGSELSVYSEQPGPYKSQVSIEVRSFEFINSEDKDGTRRAKSHAVKDFKRRQKAEGARFQRLRQSGKKKAIAANPLPNSGEGISYDQVRSSPPVILPSPTLALAGESSVDPFSHFPIQLNSSKDLGLIHHCMNTSQYLHSVCCTENVLTIQTTVHLFRSHLRLPNATIVPFGNSSSMSWSKTLPPFYLLCRERRKTLR